MMDMNLLFRSLGYYPSESQLFSLVSAVDTKMSGQVSFIQFLKIIEKQKRLKNERRDDEEEWVNAFVALGAEGPEGFVTKDQLAKVVIKDFGLNIDLEKLLSKTNVDDEGKCSFDGFKALLSAFRS